MFAGCSILIEHKPRASPEWLDLSELQLFNATGHKFPIAALGLWMSSYFIYQNDHGFDTWSIDRCFDGVVDSLCGTDTADTNPRIQITYPCSEGLSRVEVANGAWGEHLLRFHMRFLDAAGNDAATPYSFDNEQRTYTVIPG